MEKEKKDRKWIGYIIICLCFGVFVGNLAATTGRNFIVWLIIGSLMLPAGVILLFIAIMIVDLFKALKKRK